MAARLQPTIVGLGELLWDCFDDSRRPGGAPANVAYQAGQLGCRGVVCSRVGTDDPGDALLRFLENQALEIEFVQRDPVRPTGKVTVDTTLADRPQYVIHENVAWDALEFDQPAQRLMQSADAVCFGTLAQRSQTSRDTVHHCLQATRPHCLLVYDVNLRQSWFERTWIERSLKLANIVKLNHEEVDVLCDLLQIDGENFSQTILERYELELVCITRAERGCLLVSAGESIDVPGVPVDVVDAVGAGDAFTAALIAAGLWNWSLSAAARFSNEIGALVATKPGAMPELRAEFANLKEKHRPR